MARELVWLENSTFAAWRCTDCNWILPNPGLAVSDRLSAKAKEVFEQHKCAEFPRVRIAERSARVNENNSGGLLSAVPSWLHFRVRSRAILLRSA
jgi:hypothetical protein